MAKKAAETILIKPISIKSARIRIIGDSPLIVHCFDEKSKKQILDKTMKVASSGRIARNPVEDFMRSFHWLTEMPKEFTEEAFEEALTSGAKFGFPAVGFKASAISAAYRNGLSKDKVSIQGAFHIIGDMIQIMGVPNIREDMVRIQGSSADVRYRGEFKEWEVSFDIKYNTNLYSLEQIITFFNYGGFSCGIGEWRAEKGGSFGMYHVG